MLHSSNLSWAPCYVSPSSINMSLLTVARKHLTGCKALLRRQSCRFIVKWIALLNSRSSCKVNSCGLWLILSGCPVNRTRSHWFVSTDDKSSFSFSNYILLWGCFSMIYLFLTPSTDTNINQKMTSGVRWWPQAFISTNWWKKFRDKTLVEIYECGRWTEFAKTSFCIILVVLVYLESTKICTGP